MRLSRALLAFTFASAVTPAALAQSAAAPPWIPGLPVPVFLPPNFPWGATSPMPGAPTTAQPAPVPGAPQSQPAALPPGAVDGGGFFTIGFMQAESNEIIRALVASLPPGRKEKVDGIPFLFDDKTNEVNAFAGCENGASFMAMTFPLMRALGHIAEAKAADEVFGSQRVDAYTQMAANAIRSDRPVPDPPAGFYGPNEGLDPRKLARQRVVFDEMVAFVLGHELGHHYLGHTGCANGDQRGGIDPSALGRIASRAVPGLNQPNEASADVAGTQNLLDTGTKRAGGLTEMGGVLTLQFFGKLSQLTPSSIALAILRTHPAPQLRIPLIQSTAQQWRATRAAGGGAAPSPFPGLPFPFPFPLPGLRVSSRARLGLLLVALSFGFVLLAAVIGFQGIGAAFGVVLIWCAVASQLVGIAYFTGEPNVFGKRRDGSLPLARRIVFGPYLVVASAIAWLLPRLFRTRDHDEVAPGILLGRWVSPVPAHVTTVLDLTAELPRIPGGTAEYLPLPTLDGTAPDPRSVVLAVRALAGRDGAILLHCAAGHGRSAMVAAALLVERGVVETAEEAEAHLRRHRPGVSLSRDQRLALARVIDLLRAPP